MIPLSLTLLLGCAAADAAIPAAPPSSTAGAAVSSATPLDPSTLIFSEPAAGDRYHRVRAWLQDRHSDWLHLPLEANGNFLRERWCSPVVPRRDCQVGKAASGTERGRAWAELAALHYRQDFPQAFGLVLNTGAIPERGDWGARLSLSLDGRAITGSHLQISLLRLDQEQGEPLRITLGDSLGWQVEETGFRVRFGGEDRDQAALELLRSLSASPEALQGTALAQLAALEAEVLRGLAAGEARRCEYGPYLGDGLPPECTPVPLSAEQLAAEQDRVRAELGQRRALLQAEAEAAHAALVEVLPAGLW